MVAPYWHCAYIMAASLTCLSPCTTITLTNQPMRIILCSYPITLALPAFYWPRRALHFSECLLLTLCICYGCLHYLPYYRWPLKLPATPACTSQYCPARAPCLPHLPPAICATLLSSPPLLNQCAYPYLVIQ
jgi:hypothetical protein